ncbi:ScbA/BarX family gamma-butyrolactone biosynthesis protein [Kitasatospora kazusensis]|uniref:ScbA/BarX family gamma-butyrolactone biosynthesis protein n=1 Tax=Kitasatospora kazusensis TaxID=407974 RepID=A0ABN2ZIM3_9ACTN
MGSVLTDATCLLTAGRPSNDDSELHQQTVPRRYVHRASVSEVLLTGWRRIAPNRFLLGAQWPRTHSLYRPVAGVYDPLMLAETVRQSGLLIAHVGYGVPLDYPFLMWDLAYQTEPEWMTVDSAPADLLVAVTCEEVRSRRGVMAGMTYRVDVYRGGERMGGGSARFDCMAPGTYARLRAPFLAGGPVGMVPAQEARRPEAAANTVLVPTGVPNSWQIQADRRNPVLFDHPVDHVPGMVLVEAMRQAAASLSDGRPVAPFELETSFIRYAELHQPVHVRVCPGPKGEDQGLAVGVVLEQAGEPVAQGFLQLRPLPVEQPAF